MKKAIYLLIITIIILLCQEIYPQSFYFLTLRPGIKGNAMGGAQTAIVSDYQSFYYNPAGLAKVKKGVFGYSRIKYNFSSYEYKRDFWGGAVRTTTGVLGLSTYFYENIQLSFKQKNYQFSFALQLRDNILFGFSVKYLHQQSKSIGTFREEDITYSAHTGDIGFLFDNILPNLTLKLPDKISNQKFAKFKRDNFEGLSFGIALLNTGPDKVRYTTNYSEPLSQILNIGVGYKILKSDFLCTTIAVDLTKFLVHIHNDESDNFFKSWFSSWKDGGFDSFHSGLDLNILHLVSLFFGYEKFYTWDIEDNSGFTFGLAVGPEYARLESFYRVYPIYLPKPERNKSWRFGFNISY